MASLSHGLGRPRIATRPMLDLSCYDWRGAGMVAALSCGVLLALVVVFEALEASFELAVRDPLAVARAGDDVMVTYIGWLSHAGIIAWTFAGVTALMAARLQWDRGHEGGHRSAAMLVGGGLLSLGLMADDLFQLHESVIPKYSPLNEKHVMLAWVLLATAWALASAPQLLHSRHFPILGLAAGALAVSVGFDVFEEVAAVAALSEALGGQAVAEDGIKLAGVLCWAVFFWRLSIGTVATREP